MLVLSRQIDETIMIGDDIEITLVDIRGDKVRIGIKAPGSVPVHRKEVYLAIKAANEEAARAGAGAVEALGAIGGLLPAAPPKGADMERKKS
jgi:carbon storage regulator